MRCAGAQRRYNPLMKRQKVSSHHARYCHGFPQFREPYRWLGTFFLFDGNTLKIPVVGLSVLLGGTLSCQYHEECQETTEDLLAERTGLLHDYRLCLEKNQEEPPTSKDFCAPYTQRHPEIKITH